MRNQLLNVLKSKTNNDAFCIQNKRYTYGELRAVVKNVSDFLYAKKIEDAFAAIVTNDCIETYATILALWFKGIAYVPVSPNYPTERATQILKQVNCKWVFKNSTFKNKVAISSVSNSGLAVVETDKLVAQNDFELNTEVIEKDRILCILFTSGSTGIPKGVPYTLENINTTLDSFWHLKYNISGQDKFLQMFELPFDMSLLSFLPPLLLGGCIFTVKHSQIKYLELLKVLMGNTLTFTTMVPSTLNYLKPYFKDLNLTALKYTIFGGEPFYMSIAEEWKTAAPNAKIVNISGPCEITMACMGYMLDENIKANMHFNQVLAFGKPWKNTTAIIIDENHNETEVGQEGELCFAGKHIMHGYWNNEVENERVFFNKTLNGIEMRFYKTGDRSFIDEDGIFYSCGRKDFQHKIQGYKVELAEIESLVLKKFGVKNCIAIVIKSSKNINEIYLIIQNPSASKDTISNYLKQKLPAYSLPKQILTLQEFPQTLSGKIDRKKLQHIIINKISTVA